MILWKYLPRRKILGQDTWKAMAKKVRKEKVPLRPLVFLNNSFLVPVCISLSEEAAKPTVVKAAKRKGKVSETQGDRVGG